MACCVSSSRDSHSDLCAPTEPRRLPSATPRGTGIWILYWIWMASSSSQPVSRAPHARASTPEMISSHSRRSLDVPRAASRSPDGSNSWRHAEENTSKPPSNPRCECLRSQHSHLSPAGLREAWRSRRDRFEQLRTRPFCRHVSLRWSLVASGATAPRGCDRLLLLRVKLWSTSSRSLRSRPWEVAVEEPFARCPDPLLWLLLEETQHLVAASSRSLARLISWGQYSHQLMQPTLYRWSPATVAHELMVFLGSWSFQGSSGDHEARGLARLQVPGVVTLLAAISYNGSKPRLSDLALWDIPTHADDLLVDKLSPVS